MSIIRTAAEIARLNAARETVFRGASARTFAAQCPALAENDEVIDASGWVSRSFCAAHFATAVFAKGPGTHLAPAPSDRRCSHIDSVAPPGAEELAAQAILDADEQRAREAFAH